MDQTGNCKKRIRVTFKVDNLCLGFSSLKAQILDKTPTLVQPKLLSLVYSFIFET